MRKLNKLFSLILALAVIMNAVPVSAAPVIGSSDNGDGTYNNPVIWADVPDITMIRVRDTYWMASTTMHMSPGVPIMKSKDLVNWETVSYCYMVLGDTNAMRLQGGNMYSNGTWASSLNHRYVDDGNGGLKDEFILIVPSPTTNQTHVYKTEDPENMPWQRYDMPARYHDCGILLDDDGRNWMIWGTNIREMDADLTGWMPGSSQRQLINTLHAPHPETGVRPTSGLAEGIHMTKVDGMYYIIAITWPSGWPRTVVAHRAPSLDTPAGQWESKVVGMQNVPHAGGGGAGIAQGSIIQTLDGKWYGFAFRDSGSVGRLPWVVPVTWVDGWPMFGKDGSYTNIEPNYLTPGAIPVLGASGKKSVVSSDEFYNNAKKPTYNDSNLIAHPSPNPEPPPEYAYNGSNLGLDWQWNHNMDNRYWSLTERPGWLRLRTFRTAAHILMAPNSLTQRTFGPQSVASTAIDVSNMKDGDEAGISLFTARYGSIGVKMEDGEKFIVTTLANGWSSGHATNAGVESARVALAGNKVFLKAEADFLNQRDRGDFYYSYDGLNWIKLGGQLTMTYSTGNHFMGYRFLLYNFAKTETGGYVDFDYYRIDDKLTGVTAPAILSVQMDDVIAGPGVTDIEIPVIASALPNGTYDDIYASFGIPDGMTVTDVEFGSGVAGMKAYEVKGDQLILSVTGSQVDFKTGGVQGIFATIKLKFAVGQAFPVFVTPDYIIARGNQFVAYNVNGVMSAIEGLISKAELLAAIVSAEGELAAKSPATFPRPKTAANAELQAAIASCRIVYDDAGADEMDATVALKALNAALAKFRQTYALDLELAQALVDAGEELTAKQPGVFPQANSEANAALAGVIASSESISNSPSSADADIQGAMAGLSQQLGRFRNSYALIEGFGTLIETAKGELAAKHPDIFPMAKEEVNAALNAKIISAQSVYNNILTATSLEISSAQSELNSALTVFRGAYMVVWYKFDETSGTTAYDSSGNGYHGTMMNGASFTGSSVSLAGSTGTGANGQYVNLPTNILENVPGDFTVSAWVKNRAAGQQQWIRVFDFGPSGQNIMFLTARDFQFNMDNANAITAPTASRPNTAANINQWMFVAITHEGNMTRMYVNGQQVASGNQPSSSPRIPTSGGLYIGRSNWADQYPNMEIKDFRIYGRAMSALEVSGLFVEDEINTALASLSLPPTLKDGDTLPETAGTYQVVWTCSDPALLDGNKVASATQDKTVVITASIEGITRAFNVTVLGTDTTPEPPAKDGLGGNPYLPLWEHLPDGEPRVFEDPDNPGKLRAYIYGSHDVRRDSYCGPDIRAWSAPVEDLTNWRDEGPVFTYNISGQWDVMYAPDIVEVMRFEPGTVRTASSVRTVREYYLYPHSRGSNREAMVAKGSSPIGPFTPINMNAAGTATVSGSTMGFDPSVWVEYVDDPADPDYQIGFRAYGYWGFQRSYAAELDQDTMYSRRAGGVYYTYFMPSSSSYGNLRDPAGTEYPALFDDEDPRDYNYFEAHSIRKVGNKYIMIFSGYSGPDYGMGSTNSALRYCYGDGPLGPWRAGGVLVDSRGPVLNESGSALTGGSWGHNTHGSILEINGKWYAFYHRPPRGNGNARQAAVSPIKIDWDETPVADGGKVTIRAFDPYADNQIWTAKDSQGREYTGAEVNSEGFSVFGLDPYNYYSVGYVAVLSGTATLQDTYDIWDNHMPIENVRNGARAGFKYFGFGGLDETVAKSFGLRAFEGTKPENNTKFNLWLTPRTSSAFRVHVWLDGPWDNATWNGKRIGTIEVPAGSAQTTTRFMIDVSEHVDSLTKKNAVYLVVEGPAGSDLCNLIGLGFSSDNKDISRPIMPELNITVNGEPITLPALPVQSTNANGIVDYRLYQTTYVPDFRQVSVPVVAASSNDGDVSITVKQAGAFNSAAVVDFDFNGVVKTYEVFIEEPKAPVIDGIKIDGVNLPGFSPERIGYSYSAPEGTTEVPQITVDYDAELMNVSVVQATAVPGIATITVVTAISTVTYTISFRDGPIDLQVWYKLDETSGTVVNDSSGNGYHATVRGGALFNADGSGLNLDNSGSQTKHIELPKNILENTPGNFTITTMVYFRSGGTWARLFDFGPGSTQNIMFLTANTLQFNMDNANALTAPSAQNNTNNPNRWRQITITRNGNSTTMYINGVRVAGNTQTSTAPRVNTATNSGYYIGRANWSADPYPNMVVRDFRIYNRALSASEVSDLYRPFMVDDALASISLPPFLHDGEILPQSANGFNVAWTCSDPTALNGYTISGKDENRQVVLTAEVEGKTKGFNVTILKIGERLTQLIVYGDTSRVWETGQAMYYGKYEDSAIRGYNFNNGVLFARAEYPELNPDRSSGTMRSLINPWMFRMKDGTVGVVAQQAGAGRADSAVGRLYFWTTKNLVDFEYKGLITVGGTASINEPQVTYDSLADRYCLTWKGVEGTIMESFTADFASFSAASASMMDRFEPYTYGNRVVTCHFDATDPEWEYLDKKLGEVKNTSISPVGINVAVGQGVSFDSLPNVTANYSDGSTAEKRVIWDKAAFDAIDFNAPGSYTVSGQVAVKDYTPFPIISGKADPMIIRYNGRYYFIATHEANQGRVYIRQSDTLEGIRTAVEVEILRTTSSGDMSALLWAPELHVIGGKLYCFFASSTNGSGGTQTGVGGVQARYIMLNGTDPTDASHWSAPARILRKDGTNLSDGSAITLDMTYFEDNGIHYVSWADRFVGSGWASSNIAIATIDPAEPWKLTSDPVVIRRPIYGWERTENTPVLEGQFMLKRGDDLYLTYSGGPTSSAYVVGLLHAKSGMDLLDPASWSEVGYPVLESNHVPGEAGPGHNAYTKDEFGNDVFVYHARPNGGTRSAGLRTVHWAFDGTPLLYLTPDREVLPELRNVTLTVTVEGELPLSLNATMSADENGALSVNANIVSGQSELSARVIAAVYKQTGQLIFASETIIGLTANARETVPFSFDVSKESGGYYVVVFLWDKDTWVPLVEAADAVATE